MKNIEIEIKKKNQILRGFEETDPQILFNTYEQIGRIIAINSMIPNNANKEYVYSATTYMYEHYDLFISSSTKSVFFIEIKNRNFDYNTYDNLWIEASKVDSLKQSQINYNVNSIVMCILNDCLLIYNVDTLIDKGVIIEEKMNKTYSNNDNKKNKVIYSFDKTNYIKKINGNFGYTKLNLLSKAINDKFNLYF